MIPIMKRFALEECSDSRSPGVPSRARRAEPAARGHEPVPSIHDTINRGTGDRAIQKSALNDPEDPRWSGKLVARGPRAGGPSAPRPQPARPGDPAEVRMLRSGTPAVTCAGWRAGRHDCRSGRRIQSPEAQPSTAAPDRLATEVPAAGSLPPMAPPEQPAGPPDGLPAVEEPRSPNLPEAAPSAAPSPLRPRRREHRRRAGRACRQSQLTPGGTGG